MAQHGVDQVHSALLAGLAGTETMAGNDDGGVRFAGEYNPAAQDVVMGISAARTGCGVLAKRLADTANVWADAEHYASGGRSPMGMAAVSADISDASMGCSAMVPSAVGQSMGLPEGWEWIQSVCGAVWPNGDPDRLRKAAGAWKQAGNDLNSVADRLGNAQTPLLSLVTPDLNLILTKLGEFKAFVQETAQHCTDIGDACDSYAAGLDEAHNSIRTELAELLAFTVAFEAGAALLAVFTVGASEVVGNVAVVGRIALAGTRVAGIITRVGATAASIAGRISSAAAAIGRTTALVRELAVIKNITYLGSKAPAWVKLTTSMTVNTGVSVGIDAAANGGKVNHFGADLAAGFLPFGLSKITTGLKAEIGASGAFSGVSSKLDDVLRTTAGVPGAWNKQLNKVKPNTTYVVDQKFSFKTNASGQVTEGSATLDSLTPGVRNPYQQKIAGVPDRLPTDDGGHIFGTQFGGPGEAINLTAMRNDLNRLGKREYYALEQEWAKAIAEGKVVKVKINIDYPSPDNFRPKRYRIEYQIDSGPLKTQTFKN
ncbi:hypothetical protein FHU41_001832 [Psychromicrobium silvestre]|uniref:DNA/RNA non-specific endonuclease n=1 Tax=Psychromicrobium silvestre TaxID=1645614 RepID=A0A7Y9LU14_9MICC|nr:DNA/RNA non-specific endonuclease [Psychromicrobium silvestre]NYE95582.1 hypothetical protein [Psychromicrobium silvestre]